MFVYEKKLQYPVKITNTNPRLAALIISQYGGRYTNVLQRERLESALSLQYYTICQSSLS